MVICSCRHGKSISCIVGFLDVLPFVGGVGWYFDPCPVALNMVDMVLRASAGYCNIGSFGFDYFLGLSEPLF